MNRYGRITCNPLHVSQIVFGIGDSGRTGTGVLRSSLRTGEEWSAADSDS